MFGRNRCEIFVHEKDVTKVLKMIQSTIATWDYVDLTVGDCGWKNMPDCWYICFKSSRTNIREILLWMEFETIEVIDMTTPSR